MPFKTTLRQGKILPTVKYAKQNPNCTEINDVFVTIFLEQEFQDVTGEE